MGIIPFFYLPFTLSVNYSLLQLSLECFKLARFFGEFFFLEEFP